MLNKLSIEKGAVVRSRAGRDEGRLFIVLEVIDEQYVYICNGDSRKTANPKRKKLRHLKLVSSPKAEVLARLNETNIVCDYEIRNWLAQEEA